MKGLACAVSLSLLAGCAAHRSSSGDRFASRKDIPPSEGCVLDAPPCPVSVGGCAQDAACVLLSFWKMPLEPVLSAIPSDRGVTILELATILRQAGLNTELSRDDRRLQELRTSLDRGVPLLLIVEITEGADVPISPFLRTKGYPHYLVVIGYDDSYKKAVCHGLDATAVAVPIRWLRTWWKRTDYAFLRVLPPGERS